MYREKCIQKIWITCSKSPRVVGARLQLKLEIQFNVISWCSIPRLWATYLLTDNEMKDIFKIIQEIDALLLEIRRLGVKYWLTLWLASFLSLGKLLFFTGLRFPHLYNQESDYGISWQWQLPGCSWLLGPHLCIDPLHTAA